ncbi:MAG: SpoIIE family protein phosphatase [Flavobacteriales bacterium]|nr:SpoIIE family protein phosphatase [Flavobacteriales bacterium]
MEYYEKGRWLSEQCHDKEKMAESYGYIGELYTTQKDFEKGKEFYLMGLKTNLEIGVTMGIANSYNYLGSLYIDGDSLEVRLNYFKKAIVNYSELSYNRGLSGAYANMSSIYRMMGNDIKALVYSRKSLVIKIRMKDVEGQSSALSDISLSHLSLNHIDSAHYYALKAKKIAYHLNQFQIIKEAELAMYMSSKSLGLINAALEAHEKYLDYTDSLSTEKNQNALIEQQFKYNYAKRAYADSIKVSNERIIEKQLLAEHKLEAEQHKSDNYLLSAIIAVIAALTIGIFIAFINRRKSSRKILIKHEELEIQKHLVDKKNTQIIDSINYAKRIQTALLKNDEHFAKLLPPHFILYKPKDIVSGDFYWTHEKHGYLYLCVADCTGHGVPGAFMSMLGIAFLQEIINVAELLSPNDVLNELRNRIILELSQTGNIDMPMDGMDVAMIRYHKETHSLEWCGANNGLFIISKNDYASGLPKDRTRIVLGQQLPTRLFEILPQRQPVGFQKNSVPFETRKIVLAKEDLIYLYTDGYSDQFGGMHRKKFKLSQLKKLLLKNYDLPLDKQKTALETEYYRWKGDLGQLDDICIIGLKL